MRYVIVVAGRASLVAFTYGSIGEVTLKLMELQVSSDVLHEIGLHLIRAKVGEWIDWPRGYLFITDGTAKIVADSASDELH